MLFCIVGLFLMASIWQLLCTETLLLGYARKGSKMREVREMEEQQHANTLVCSSLLLD